MAGKLRFGVVAVTSALVAVIGAADARPHASVPRPCPKLTVAAHRWAILVSGISCSTGATIVRTLGRRRVPAARAYAGTYSGLRCVGGPAARQLPKSLICGKAGAAFPALTAVRGT
jgi:hypothetical protein